MNETASAFFVALPQASSPPPRFAGMPGLSGPLVDAEGFPRADIDIFAVRETRHRLACLRTDYLALQKRIEKHLQAALAPPASSAAADEPAGEKSSHGEATSVARDSKSSASQLERDDAPPLLPGKEGSRSLLLSPSKDEATSTLRLLKAEGGGICFFVRRRRRAALRARGFCVSGKPQWRGWLALWRPSSPSWKYFSREGSAGRGRRVPQTARRSPKSPGAENASRFAERQQNDESLGVSPRVARTRPSGLQPPARLLLRPRRLKTEF